MKKKNILIENWQIKLLALVAAIFLWLYAGMIHKTNNGFFSFNSKNTAHEDSSSDEQ